MARKKRGPAEKPPPSDPAAQALLAKVLLRVGEKHDDDAMRDAGERLAKAAKKVRE